MILKTKNQKLTVITILLIICCVLIYFYSQNIPKKNQNLSKVDQKEIKATTLSVNGKEYSVQISEPISVYGLMNQLQKSGEINFKTKEYAGLGQFVEEINGEKGEGGKSWIYYVNGEKAELGISNYQLRPGDAVSWQLENY